MITRPTPRCTRSGGAWTATALGLGLAIGPTAACASSPAPSTASPASSTAPTTRPVLATLPTTAASTGPDPGVRSQQTFVVIAGTFTTRQGADRRLAAIAATGIRGMTVRRVGSAASARYRIEARGLTEGQAKAVVSALKARHISAVYVAH